MNANDNYIVSNDFSGSRLDRWIKKHYPDISHSDLEIALRKGDIKVNDSKAKSNYRINLSDKISVSSFLNNKKKPSKNNYKRSSRKEIENMLIYEDDEILVINKPYGIPVQGGSKIKKHIDGLLRSSYTSLQPRLVHRIDRETSGILLVALNRKIADFLSYSFREKKITKFYWAITYGNLSKKAGVIDKRLKRKNSNTYIDALTEYTNYMNFKDKLNFMVYKPITGRNHQIRIHSYDLGVPILGDKKYGYNLDDNKKLHLHSKSIEFIHPNGKKMYFEADLPPHMQETWNLYNLPYEIKL